MVLLLYKENFMHHTPIMSYWTNYNYIVMLCCNNILFGGLVFSCYVFIVQTASFVYAFGGHFLRCTCFYNSGQSRLSMVRFSQFVAYKTLYLPQYHGPEAKITKLRGQKKTASCKCCYSVYLTYHDLYVPLKVYH